MIKSSKFAEKLTATQSMSYIIWNIKFCNEKEAYIGKTIGNNTKGFKVRRNKHISNCKGFQHVRAR